MTPEAKERVIALLEEYVQYHRITDEELINFVSLSLPEVPEGDIEDLRCPRCGDWLEGDETFCTHCDQRIDIEGQFAGEWLKEWWINEEKERSEHDGIA